MLFYIKRIFFFNHEFTNTLLFKFVSIYDILSGGQNVYF